MDVLIITVFISLVLVAVAVLLLAKRTRAGDFEHGDRLSLLPLEDDSPSPRPAEGDPGAPGGNEAAGKPSDPASGDRPRSPIRPESS
jgi:hypothetical protein